MKTISKINIWSRINQRIHDWARERRIETCAYWVKHSQGSERRYWLNQLEHEVSRRSPQQIARMERRQGVVV